MEHISVIKIGGNIVDNPQALARFAEDFSSLLAGPKILVHGGGKEATRLSGALGIETTMIAGRRVTSRETLDVVTMVYAGLINKRVVALLQSAGCDATGLCGADGGILPAARRDPEPVDYGYVGDIDPARINTRRLADMLDGGLTPVFCAIAYDGAGGLLNCNADSVASAIAVAASSIAPTDLCFCFEKAGVLADIDNPASVIPAITAATYPDMIRDAIISDGMIPKIDNAFRAIAAGVAGVTIKHAGDLLTAGSGTRISAG